jgi:hypothetical protein
MDTLTHVFTISCTILTLWLCFKWSTKTFADSMLKVVLFLLAVTGIVIELKAFNIL